jgi:tRNA (guanine37-N1)-methyltransferase
MLLKPEPIFEAVEKLATETTRVILVSPSGVLYTQAHAWRLTQYGHLLIICGAYEGVDERVRICLADEVFSIGDYVLTNGALPAMVIIDSVVRLLPGVLGDDQSAESESFANGILEYPHYTRPAVFRRMAVPEVLLSGNHAAIQKWRFQEAIRRTREYRPDLYQRFLANHEKDKWSGPGDKHAK